MSVTTERTTLQVTFPKEKLEALRFYMAEKELTVEGIYEKYIPAPTRRYLERADTEHSSQSSDQAVIAENIQEPASASNSRRSGRRQSRRQTVREQTVDEQNGTVPEEGSQEHSQEQAGEENPGMVMSM